MSERVSIREYARRRDVSHVAVLHAIRDGRLREAIVVEGTAKRIDVEVADREWRTNTDERKRTDGRATAIPEATSTPRATTANGAARTAETISGVDVIGSSFQRARAAGETLKAKLLDLEYKREAGLVVDIEFVQARIADHVRAAIDALAARRRRLAPELALQTDPRAIEQALEQADREFATQLAALAAAPDAQAEAA